MNWKVLVSLVSLVSLVRLVGLVSFVGLVESIENGRRSVHSNFVGSLCSDPLLARSDRKL